MWVTTPSFVRKAYAFLLNFQLVDGGCNQGCFFDQSSLLINACSPSRETQQFLREIKGFIMANCNYNYVHVLSRDNNVGLLLCFENPTESILCIMS